MRATPEPQAQNKGDSDLEAIAATSILSESGRLTEQIARFKNGIADSEALRIEDGDHWIFVSHEDDVVNAINEFASCL